MPLPPLNHVPALLLAASFTFGGMKPLWNAPGAIREYGLPERFQNSPIVHPVFTVYASRMTMLGMLMFMLYFQEHYAALDACMACLAWPTTVDVYIAYKEDILYNAWFRGLAGLLFSSLGWYGITSGR